MAGRAGDGARLLGLVGLEGEDRGIAAAEPVFEAGAAGGTGVRPIRRLVLDGLRGREAG